MVISDWMKEEHLSMRPTNTPAVAKEASGIIQDVSLRVDSTVDP
jgi:hypothetical protein